jgi:hydrogenase expression/formation protein HypE
MKHILMSHGAGGWEMGELIRQVFVATYGPPDFQPDDCASLKWEGSRLAFTIDSYVVDPLFFPGGDIGRLAVAGTVNDLLTAGARPLALSASFIIEEGFGVADLKRIAQSMAATAAEAGVALVTGDTKVVPRGAADRLFITTSGIGRVQGSGLSGAQVKPGDQLILTGPVGSHGLTVLLAREKLLEGEDLKSDVAPLADMILPLWDHQVPVHAMRDPTRGGLAAALNEIARQSQVGLELWEEEIPVPPGVAAACDALGLEVLNLANEGIMLIFVAPEGAFRALELVKSSPYGREARIIGRARDSFPGRVYLRTRLGTSRLLPFPSGELVPRIC